MAKLPPKQEAGNDQEWLNTYADMVTLLLTFFVLLFACSNLDESKVQFIYQAFQTRGKFINTVVAKPNDPGREGVDGVTDDPMKGNGEGDMPQSYDELYQYLAEFIENNNLADDVSIENSAAYFTLRFNSSVFFDGDSYFLKDEGKALLYQFSNPIRALQSTIKTLTVTGHTSVGSSDISDWTLSSMRAASVANYLDTGLEKPMVSPEKFRTRGCGNTEPRFPNNTLEGRRQNRRVELVMLKDNLDFTSDDVIKDILKHDFGIDTEQHDVNDPNNGQDYTTLPEGSVDKIIGFIEDKFRDDGLTHIGTMGPGAVDGNMFIASESSDDSGGNADDAGGGEEQSE